MCWISVRCIGVVLAVQEKLCSSCCSEIRMVRITLALHVKRKYVGGLLTLPRRRDIDGGILDSIIVAQKGRKEGNFLVLWLMIDSSNSDANDMQKKL